MSHQVPKVGTTWRVHPLASLSQAFSISACRRIACLSSFSPPTLTPVDSRLRSPRITFFTYHIPPRAKRWGGIRISIADS